MSQILVFGDSIVYGCWDKEGGWVNRLRMWIDQKNMQWADFYYSVYNLGISGNTTNDLLLRIKKEIPSRISQNETIIVFAIGINDSQFLIKEKRLNISPEQFEINLKKLISISREYSRKIIFVGLNPVDQEKVDPMSWADGESYRNNNIQQYGDIIKKVCFKEKIYFIKIFDEWMKLDYKKLLEDGAHPNSLGHQQIFEKVKEFLIKNKIFKQQVILQ